MNMEGIELVNAGALSPTRSWYEPLFLDCKEPHDAIVKIVWSDYRLGPIQAPDVGSTFRRNGGETRQRARVAWSYLSVNLWLPPLTIVVENSNFSVASALPSRGARLRFDRPTQGSVTPSSR